MKYDDRKVAGALSLVGSVQFLLVMVITESLYPGYSVSENYISDLGVGTTSLIFNSSVFLLGVAAVAGAYFIQRAFASRLFSLLLTITGLGAMGAGMFSETAGEIHGIASLITFLFGGLSVVLSYKLQKPPLSYSSVLLGALSLVALALFGSSTYLGLGKGGMERMIAYPSLLWAVGFGSHLMIVPGTHLQLRNHSPQCARAHETPIRFGGECFNTVVTKLFKVLCDKLAKNVLEKSQGDR